MLRFSKETTCSNRDVFARVVVVSDSAYINAMWTVYQRTSNLIMCRLYVCCARLRLSAWLRMPLCGLELTLCAMHELFETFKLTNAHMVYMSAFDAVCCAP